MTAGKLTTEDTENTEEKRNVSHDERRLFVLSTAHLHRKTAESHNTYKEDGYLWPIPYGYICWVWETDDITLPENLPPDLREVVDYLRNHNHANSGDYIRFDCDGATLPELTTYDW